MQRQLFTQDHRHLLRQVAIHVVVTHRKESGKYEATQKGRDLNWLLTLVVYQTLYLSSMSGAKYREFMSCREVSLEGEITTIEEVVSLVDFV